MGDEPSDTMNLDLNLDPDPESMPEPLNLGEWIEDPIHRIRDTLRNRARQQWILRQLQVSREDHNTSVDLDQLMVNPGNETPLQIGEGSVTAEERTNDIPKTCDLNTVNSEDQMSSKDDVEKGNNGNNGSFFDCNICLVLARDPVVSFCGHLFCWSCLYCRLYLNSDKKECPVCKEELTIKSVTPIYGRGNNTPRELERDASLQIPQRPHARRIDSLRQTLQRVSFALPLEEMIRSIGNRFDLTRDLVLPPQDPDSETLERANTTLFGGTQSQRAIVFPLTRASLIPSERVFGAYLRRNHAQSLNVDDMDSSISSFAADMNSESQMDNIAEIDSMVSLSTSSSRRRNDGPRISTDVENGGPRVPRRRRLN